MKGSIFPMIKNLSIAELKQLPVSSEFKVIGVISRFARRKDKNNNPFWELTISDSTGYIDGKVWPAAIWWNTEKGEKFPIDPDNCGLRFEGSSVELVGMTAQFREQMQYNIETVYYLDQDEFPPQNFTKSSPIPFRRLESSFRNLIESVSHKPLQDFINAVFFTHGLWENFKIWPAAITIHHAYAHGLLEHSVSVAESAIGMADHYSEFGVQVNHDILVAGSLLHDIGKIEAYDILPSVRLNTAGNVIEHITLGYHMFMRYAELENLDDNIAMALSHIILSHHGKREYGSPVLPATPEAMIVNASDDTDFKLSLWKAQTDALVPQAEITEYLPMIDRRLWKGINLK